MTPTRQRILIAGLIAFGLLSIGFFGMRTFHALRQFRGHRPPPPGKVETDVEKIRDWMTIPFISRTYLIPDRVLFEAAGIPEQGNRGKSLKALNDKYYPQTGGVVMEKIKAAIQERQPPLPPEPPTAPIPPQP